MIFWVTSLDGSINFRVTAGDAAEALDKLGRSLRYPDFAAMAHDLHYGPGDLQIATLEVETATHDQEGNRRLLDQQGHSITTEAFKRLRKLTG